MNMFVLVMCLIQVESGGDSGAVGDGGKAVGCLQLHEVFVDDVNRILGSKEGTYHELNRRDRMMSMQMAKIWLAYYRGRWEERFVGEPTYEDMAMIFNRGYRGYCKYVDENADWRGKDPYWLKVKAALDELVDW